MPTLFIIRGLPGSGKSTVARKIAHVAGIEHVEADMYFMKSNEYHFDPKQLGAAHRWCFETVAQCINRGEDVVVSNTFTKLWEMQNYILKAFCNDYNIRVIQCNGKWDNVHNVPQDKLDQMRDRFEDNSTIATKYTPDENIHFEYHP